MVYVLYGDYYIYIYIYIYVNLTGNVYICVYIWPQRDIGGKKWLSNHRRMVAHMLGNAERDAEEAQQICTYV
jgi:hypothetical protein